MRWLQRVLCVVLGLTASCSTHKPAPEAQHSFTAHDLSPETKMAVVEKGDLGAYESLIIGYLNSPFPGELLPYALLMVHKHGHAGAAYEVFSCLAFEFYRDGVEGVDPETANLAVRYLLQAAAAGREQAVQEVREYGIVYDEARNREQLIRLVLAESS